MAFTLQQLKDRAAQAGTDDQYRAWIQTMPSCISGKYSEWMEDIGEWRNPACHVRRSLFAGMRMKPDFSCVPMTHEEHHDQTVKGEAYCLGVHTNKFPWSIQEAKGFFDEQVIRYLIIWINRH